MDGSKVNKNARTIDLKANSNREFFLIHGYTGSPTDFNNLGKYLHDRFNANVKIIRLVGHGEKIESLDELEYKDFLTHAERELKKDIAKRRKIIIGGLSVGGFIAMQLASKYPVKGVIGISLPFEGRVMTKIITFIEPLIVKKYWKKPASKKEIKMRKNAYFYSARLLGLRVIKRGKKEVEGKLKGIKAPCLIIHVLNDKIFTSYIRDFRNNGTNICIS